MKKKVFLFLNIKKDRIRLTTNAQNTLREYEQLSEKALELILNNVIFNYL
jgi:hypothetical protein